MKSNLLSILIILTLVFTLISCNQSASSEKIGANVNKQPETNQVANVANNQTSNANAANQENKQNSTPPLTQRQENLAVRAILTLEKLSEAVNSGESIENYNKLIENNKVDETAKTILLELPRNGDSVSPLQQSLIHALYAHQYASFVHKTIELKPMRSSAPELDRMIFKMFGEQLDGKSSWVQDAVKEFETKGTYDNREALLKKLWEIADKNTTSVKQMLAAELKKSQNK